MQNINSFVALHDVHDKPVRTFYMLPHNVCNARGHAYCIQQHIHDMLLRKSPGTCAKFRCLVTRALHLKNRFQHNPCPIQCSAPSWLHLFHRGRRQRILRRPLHNPKVFELKIRVCVLNDDERTVDVDVPFLFGCFKID